MRLVDGHAHVGTCRVFGLDQPADVLLAAMGNAAVTAAVVQPFPGSPDAMAEHAHIARLTQLHPGRIFGLCSLSPHRDPAEYREAVRHCVKDLGFVGVKAHSIGHSVSPTTPDADLIFSTATDLAIPVMVHTGPGIPFADPAMWIPLARRYPNTTVILAHAGAGIFSGSAIVAAEVCANIILETSWCRPQDIRTAVRQLGPQRVMFGSDMPFNITVEVAKYQAIGLSDAELDDVLWRTATRVFGLPEADGQ